MTAGRFCPRCGADVGRGGAQIRSVAVLVPLVVLVIVLAALSMHASRTTAVMESPLSTSRLIQSQPLPARWQSTSGATSSAALSAVANNLPGTLSLMTSEEGRLAAVKSFVGRLPGRPLTIGDLSSALVFFTSEPHRVEAVRLLAAKLRPADANADLTGPLSRFTSDEGRAAAIEAIRGAQ